MYRVLLADDEQIERMALARRLMRRFGDILQISEATNGKEAVQLYEKEHSQIIIMDISIVHNKRCPIMNLNGSSCNSI